MFEIFEDDFGFHFRLSRNQKIHHYADHWKPVADPVHHLGGGRTPKMFEIDEPSTCSCTQKFSKIPYFGEGEFENFPN